MWDEVCNHFLEAVEKKQYRWFWVCPNGNKECHYRHALPPCYILKSQMKALLEEEANKLAIEDEIEEQVLTMEDFEHLYFMIFFGEKGSEKIPLSQNAPFFTNSDPDCLLQFMHHRNTTGSYISNSFAVKENGPSNASDQDIVNCHESVIYILAPLRYAIRYGCSDASIVVGAVGKVPSLLCSLRPRSSTQPSGLNSTHTELCSALTELHPVHIEPLLEIPRVEPRALIPNVGDEASSFLIKTTLQNKKRDLRFSEEERKRKERWKDCTLLYSTPNKMP
ncbi:hypothetical protein L1887_40142 [Cichorium endivia]|nr:hypothetical protein L1887_40142 [Cichorium endivia]